MSRRKKRPHRKSSATEDVTRSATGGQATDEQTPTNRAEDVLTVGWMLTTMATFVIELSAYGGWVFFATLAKTLDRTNEFLALPNMLHFSAMVTGCLGLLLAAIAYRIRSTPAPRTVTIVAIAVCLLPILTTLFRAAL